MSTPTTTLAYAELLSNIRQVSAVAVLRTPSSATTRVALVEDGRVLELTHDGAKVQLQLPAPVVAPPKLPQLAPGTQEASWRFQLANPEAGAREVDFSDSAIAPWPSTALEEKSEIRCSKCGNMLLPSGTIKSWKDLPSENWAEMMDFWHCHKPDVPKVNGASGHQHSRLEDRGYGANTRFVARPGVGFVDLTYFLVSANDCQGVKYANPGETAATGQISYQDLLCQACNATIGALDAVADGYRFFKWALSVSERPSKASITHPTSVFITSHLLSLIAAQGVHKFILHSTDSIATSSSVLSLWVFSPRLKVAFASPTSSSKPLSVSKIFYRVIDVDEATSIIRDAGTSNEEVRLPVDVITMVTADLQESTLRLPPSARVFATWSMGFLERSSEG